MKLIILAVSDIADGNTHHHHRTGNTGSGAGAQHHRHAANAGSGPICYSCCRQPGSDRAYPHQSSAHHCDSASGTREHSRFRSGRFRVLALDRRGQSRFLETHFRGRQHQRRPGLRIRAHLFLPCLRAARPTTFSRSHRQRGRERPPDFTHHTSARLLWRGIRLQPINRWRSRRGKPPWPRRPRRNSRSWRSGSRPRERSIPSGPSIPRA